eukprot:m.520482 g.520482  ORF g.520482 m.520482 type:complete len:1243 (-) comp21951_c0_seq22:149-3877(-)
MIPLSLLHHLSWTHIIRCCSKNTKEHVVNNGKPVLPRSSRDQENSSCHSLSLRTMGRFDGSRKNNAQNSRKSKRRRLALNPVCKRVQELIKLAKSFSKVDNDEIEAAVGRVVYFRMLRSLASQTSAGMLCDMFSTLLGNGYVTALECLAPKIVADQKLSLHEATSVLASMPYVCGLDPCIGARVVNLLVPVTMFGSDVAARYWASRARWTVLEFLEETHTIVERIRTSSLADCVRRGTAVGGLVFCRSSGKRKHTVVLERQLVNGRKPAIPHAVLANGDAAVLTLVTPAVPRTGQAAMSSVPRARVAFEVNVVSVWGSTVEVAPRVNGDVRVLHALEEHSGAVWRIDKGSNMRQYQRILRALGDMVVTMETNGVCAAVVRSLDAARPVPSSPEAHASASNDDGGTAAVDTPSPMFAIPSQCFSSGKIARLNASQRQAWAAATGNIDTRNGALGDSPHASEAVTLIQGPPGTGKTTVALSILQQWVHDAGWPEIVSPVGQTQGSRIPHPRDGGVEPIANPWLQYHRQQPCPYPCCTPGGKLSPVPGADIHSLVGLPRAVLCCSDSNTAVDNLLEGLLRRGVRAVRVGRSENIRSQLWAYTLDATMHACRRMDGDNEATHRRNNLAHTLYHAQVVCATCIGAGSPVFTQNNVPMSFRRVLIDEATQAMEIASIVPLLRKCHKLVLIGDHAQLPPTILSSAAASEGCEMSLFERMAHSTCVRPPILLEQQYRMHPSIAEFPSDCFYGGRVRNGVSRDERPLPRGFRWPNPDIPVAFIDCADGHEIRAEGQSLYNTEEIDAVMCIVGQLLQGGCSPQAIGVVAPYSAQVTRLRRRLCVFDHNRAEGCFVECSSVDAFQGREKDVIVISTVRANSHEHVGFLSDWRRTNVAITRARCGLVVVGHRRTLLHEPLSWAPWLRWAACRGICQGQTSCGSTARHDQALLQDHSRVLLRMSHRSLWWQPNGADAVPRRHAGKHALHDRVCEVGSLSDMDFQNRDAFLGGGLSGGGTRGGALSDDNEPPTFMTLLVSTPPDLVTLSPPLRTGAMVQLVRRTVSGWLQVTPVNAPGALHPAPHTESECPPGTPVWVLPTAVRVVSSADAADAPPLPECGRDYTGTSVSHGNTDASGAAPEVLGGDRMQQHSMPAAPRIPVALSSPGTPPVSPSTPAVSPGTPVDSPGIPGESPGTPADSPETLTDGTGFAVAPHASTSRPLQTDAWPLGAPHTHPPPDHVHAGSAQSVATQRMR